MNNNYYQNPIYPTNNQTINNPNSSPTYDQPQNRNTIYTNPISDEQLYIENILKTNRGKKAKIHITVPGSIEWQDKIFEGIIEQSGKDHIIVSNPNNGEWHIIPLIYLVFITLEEPINNKTDYY